MDKMPWIDNGFGPVHNPNLTEEEFIAALERLRENNILTLWQSANNYETAQINGSASAMVVLGLVKGSPAALRVSAWTQSIWELYYKRKPLITHEWNEELLDFSECGPMPCTVSELMKEIMS